MTQRLLVLPVYQEEQWPSIHFCAEMLFDQLVQRHPEFETVTPECRFRARFGCIPALRQGRFVRNADRLINRFWDYSRALKQAHSRFDVFHVCDHSYSQLLHDLPAERTGVLCQDLDTFRCLLEPQQEPRPWWFRRMTRHILDGFQKAAVVFYTTEHVRQQIEKYDLVDRDRLVHAPHGIAPEFAAIARASEMEGEAHFGRPYLLHVGSCIPRKRIDVLLRVFAEVRARWPELRLIKVGGEFTDEQQALLAELQLAGALEHQTGLSRSELAKLYRGAVATLVTSDREGFGLPVIEALACGSIVVASDIPAVREVGGTAAIYCPVGDLQTWVATVELVLSDPASAPALSVRRAQALRFTWEAHADTIADAYRRLAAAN